MISYELSLNYKQGDDLAGHLENSATPADGFASWAKHHKQNMLICEQISKILEKVEVEVFADTHMISLKPKNDTAREALEMLVNEGVLYRHEWDDEDGGEDVDDEDTICSDPDCPECGGNFTWG